MLRTDIRQHNRYCPCCKDFNENEMRGYQMNEFLQYIKDLHYKLNGPPKDPYKKVKPKEQRLENDSVSEITDLDTEGILTTSIHQLSSGERRRLRIFASELRPRDKQQTVEMQITDAV